MGVATNSHQEVELLRHGVQQNASGEAGVELRHADGSRWAEQLVILVAQHLGAGKDGHGIPVVQGDELGVHAGHILHHADHGGVIVTQHIQLQQVLLHGMVFEMSGDLVGFGVVRRLLDGTEVPDLVFLGNNDQTAGVLARGAAHADTARRQTVLLGAALLPLPLAQILLDVAVGGLFRDGTDSARTEHMGGTKHGDTVLVCSRLILAGEIQVDIGDLIAAEAQEGLEGDVEAVLFQLGSALGAFGIGQVRAAVASVGHIQDGVLALGVGAAVVGREGVDLRDARHKCHDGGADGATGADQIAVLQTVLHQSLGGHINDIVVTGDDVVQLHFDALDEALGGIVAVEPVELAVDQILQVLHGVFDLGSEQIFRHGPQGLALIRDEIGIGDDHLEGLLRAQIAELPEHLVGGAEVQGVRGVAVLKALGGQQNVAEDLVLGVQEVNVTGGADGLIQLLAQADHGAVEVPELFLGLDHLLAEHELIVVQGLDLEKIVEGGDPQKLVLALVIDDGLEQLTGLTGGADDQTLPVAEQLGLGDSGHTLEVFQISQRNEVVEVPQALLVLGVEDDVPGLTVVDLAAAPQGGHGGVDLLDGIHTQLPELGHQPVEDQAAGHGIVGGTVVVEFRQTQGVRHDVELELVQMA